MGDPPISSYLTCSKKVVSCGQRRLIMGTTSKLRRNNPSITDRLTQVATVLQAESDDDERIVDLEKYHLDCSGVQEADVMALINNRRLAVVLNLTGCKW